MQVGLLLYYHILRSQANLRAGTGYMFLFFGWGCVIWQPLALQYGKRPVYLFSMLATLVRSSPSTTRMSCGASKNLHIYVASMYLPILSGNSNVVSILQDKWPMVCKQDITWLLWISHRIPLWDLGRRLGRSDSPNLISLLTSTVLYSWKGQVHGAIRLVLVE